MILKTFIVWKSIDLTYTGNGIRNNDQYLNQIDDQINKYARENKLEVRKIQYSTVNENIQQGSHVMNTERRTHMIAAVLFEKRKRWF